MHAQGEAMEEAAARPVFVAFDDADEAFARGSVIPTLEAAGLTILTDDEIAPGTVADHELERIVEELRGRVVLVTSPAFVANREAGYVEMLATWYGRETKTYPVIPLAYRKTEGLPLRLRMLKEIDATDAAERPAALARLVAALEAEPGPPPERPPCPYPGMVPITDPALYHGRERDIEEVVDRLATHPFLAVIGASGTGKSSLLTAGVVPALRRSGRFGAGNWIVVPVTAKEGAAPPAAAELLRRLDSPSDRLLVMVDQLERALAGAGADTYGQALVDLAAHDQVWVLCALRSDFYGTRPASLRQPMRQHHHELDPLDREALVAAIVEPARSVGVYVDTELVERLVAEAGEEPGILPFLQLTLLQLWDHVDVKQLPTTAYAKILPPAAGVAASGLDAAIARHADSVIATLPATTDEDTARNVLVRLVQIGDDHPHVRRTQRIADLRAVAESDVKLQATLDHLSAEQNRLVVLGRSLDLDASQGELDIPPEDVPVELVHDAVIRGWPRLKAWIEQRRTTELRWRQVERDAANWDRAGRPAWRPGRLYSFSRLSEARAARDDLPGVVADEATAFLDASRRADLALKGAIWAATALVLLLAVLGVAFAADWRAERSARRTAASEMTPIGAGLAVLGRDGAQERLPGFRIETHEVTAAEYQACVDRGRCTEPLLEFDPAIDPGAGPADPALPIRWVTASQAQAFCEWIGRDLPTWAQWERAARGPEGRMYPWGDDKPTGDHARASGLGEAHEGPIGPTAEGYEAGRTRSATAVKGETSPEDGIAHLVGNVAEWTRTHNFLEGRECHRSHECLGLEHEWHRADGAASLVTVGGSFDDPANPVYDGSGRDAADSHHALGFRCAKGG